MEKSDLLAAAPATLSDLRIAITNAQDIDENEALKSLIEVFPLDDVSRARVQTSAEAIVAQSRALKNEQGTLDAFLAEFGLSNQEGVALMCLAEALLRVPDNDTRDDLIAEKILSGDWQAHAGKSDSVFVNASTWALMLTGRVIELDKNIEGAPKSWLKSLVNRTGEPVIRGAVGQAMKIMGRQFVFGRNIGNALKRQSKEPAESRTMSFDMLGEGARTMATAERYYKLYADSIQAVGKEAQKTSGDVHDRSSVSIKLSALHPRYQDHHKDRVIAEMLPWVRDLAQQAKSFDIQLTIDAEEADRLDLQLDMLEALARDESLKGWNGLGLAVQAYQKRCPLVIDWLIKLAKDTGRTLAVRLVKGAYWDTEIKEAQALGRKDYPVWTRKASTDLCYLTCARKMLDSDGALYPQFATHNAHTIAAIQHMAGDVRFEFQRLHGMGALLYKAGGMTAGKTIRTRTYAPVGEHEDLLPYLVRRLLENGANSSFVNRFMDADVPVSEVAADPMSIIERAPTLRHSAIPTPANLYGENRLNSRGLNLENRASREELIAALDAVKDKSYEGACLVAGMEVGDKAREIFQPQDKSQKVGTVREARAEDIETALTRAQENWGKWDELGGVERGKILRACGDALEAEREQLISIMVREAGKTLEDCVDEVREAVDFCRFYAVEAEKKFSDFIQLPGPTGESNRLTMRGRGVFLCISPWNFPLAIFAGQIMAALAAGNAVIAKPAEQTPLTAYLATKLFHKAGVPGDVLHLLLGDGASVGGPLVEDLRITGVAFTGSTGTAKLINRTLAGRDGAIVPLIAETGGLNAMIVDSTALPEQVTDDVLRSAFGSAGQRCSALRVLYVQDSIADGLIDMIKGAMKELKVGDPSSPKTDVGPIIDLEARDNLARHAERMTSEAKFIAKAEMGTETENGSFIAPQVFEVSKLADVGGEHFGPILHVIRFDADNLDSLMKDIRDSGFGLTFGVHSRLEERWANLFANSRAGNVYINRNMTGAVVGVQPFGGEGLSGTGPKAGGPNYVTRFAVERTLTINTAAVGGNAELFALPDDLAPAE